MSSQSSSQASPDVLVGANIVAAYSSLTAFCCEFDNAQALILEAPPPGSQSGKDEIVMRVLPASEMPREADAVCKVDWSWIYGRPLQRLATTGGVARLEIKDVGPLTISVQLWQGKPFLAFQPFKPA